MSIVTVSSRNARTNFRDLLDSVLSGASDVVIERNGKPVAVMIPVPDYEELSDALDDLRASRQVALVYESWKRDPSTARPLEEIEAELRGEGLLDDGA